MVWPKLKQYFEKVWLCGSLNPSSTTNRLGIIPKFYFQSPEIWFNLDIIHRNLNVFFEWKPFLRTFWTTMCDMICRSSFVPTDLPQENLCLTRRRKSLHSQRYKFFESRCHSKRTKSAYWFIASVQPMVHYIFDRQRQWRRLRRRRRWRHRWGNWSEFVNWFAQLRCEIHPPAVCYMLHAWCMFMWDLGVRCCACVSASCVSVVPRDCDLHCDVDKANICDNYHTSMSETAQRIQNHSAWWRAGRMHIGHCFALVCSCRFLWIF